MAPPSAQQTLLSPAELDFLSSSLKQNPPIRFDLRSTTDFRPLVAETDILSSAYGSARVCFSDGTEAIAGVKAELERSAPALSSLSRDTKLDTRSTPEAEADQGQNSLAQGKGLSDWLEIAIDIPGFRDDDALPVFLAAMLSEALLANQSLKDKLWINERWHWKLYVDVLSLSPPLSYPLPLLSLTTHLALLNTSLPRLKSDLEDDPLFDDDWAAAVPLFPRDKSGSFAARPPVTLLVITVGENIVFDPTAEELAVAESVVALSFAPSPSSSSKSTLLQLLSVRLVDPPSRLTAPGTLSSLNQATGSEAPRTSDQAAANAQTTWRAPRGGVKRSLLAKIIKTVLQPGGVGSELLDAVATFLT